MRLKKLIEDPKVQVTIKSGAPTSFPMRSIVMCEMRVSQSIHYGWIHYSPRHSRVNNSIYSNIPESDQKHQHRTVSNKTLSKPQHKHQYHTEAQNKRKRFNLPTVASKTTFIVHCGVEDIKLLKSYWASNDCESKPTMDFGNMDLVKDFH